MHIRTDIRIRLRSRTNNCVESHNASLNRLINQNRNQQKLQIDEQREYHGGRQAEMDLKVGLLGFHTFLDRLTCKLNKGVEYDLAITIMVTYPTINNPYKRYF